MLKHQLLLLLILFLTSTQQHQDKCRILALMGGGDKGSYESGAIFYLLTQLGEESQYDVISGVSAGALNAGALGMFNSTEQQQAAEYLLEIWQKISKDQVYENWTFGVIEGLFSKSGFFNTAPLRAFLTARITQLKRYLSIGTTDAGRGTYVTYNSLYEPDTPQNQSRIVDVLMASSAIPILFPSQTFDNITHIDGGVLDNLDLGSAIERCVKFVESERDIIIDIVQPSGYQFAEKDVSKSTAFQMIQQYYHINEKDKTFRDNIYVQEEHPLVQVRHVIYPNVTIDNGDPESLNFDHQTMLANILQGMKDAEIVVNSTTIRHEDQQYLESKKQKIMDELLNRNFNHNFIGL